MKILITGASGNLGTRLLKALQNNDIKFRALIHEKPLKLSGIETITGDLKDPEVLDLATRGIDTVVHLAAITHSNCESDYLNINWEGSRKLYQASVKNDVQRFIFMSSRAAGFLGGPYSASKQKAEEFIMQGAIPWVVLRPSEVYGAGSPDAVNQLIRWIKDFKIVPIVGNGQYRLSPVFIDDVIPAFVEVILQPNISREVFTFCGPEEIEFKELIVRLSRILKVRPFKFFIPVSVMEIAIKILVLLGINILTKDQVARLMSEKVGDNENSKKLLKFDPRTLEEGLQNLN